MKFHVIGVYHLVRSIMSKATPERISNRPRHGGVSTLEKIAIGSIVRASVPLEENLGTYTINREIDLWDIDNLLGDIRSDLREELEEKSRLDKKIRVSTYLTLFDQLVDEVSQAEIARTLNISRARVGQLRAKLLSMEALKKFKGILEEHRSGGQ